MEGFFDRGIFGRSLVQGSWVDGVLRVLQRRARGSLSSSVLFGRGVVS